MYVATNGFKVRKPHGPDLEELSLWFQTARCWVRIFGFELEFIDGMLV